MVRTRAGGKLLYGRIGRFMRNFSAAIGRDFSRVMYQSPKRWLNGLRLRAYVTGMAAA